MRIISYLVLGIMLAFIFYTLDLFYKIHQDIKFIKNHIEKIV
jgi:hypothetical protein